MASQDESTHRGVRRRDDRLRAHRRPDHVRSEHQYPTPSEFCALCFLTLGSKERSVHWGEGFAHPSCVGRQRTREAA